MQTSTDFKPSTTSRLTLPRLILALGITAGLPCGVFAADAPATQPAAANGDSPEVKIVRDTIIDWDKTVFKHTLEQERKLYHTSDEKEAKFMDFVAHENWEESKTQEIVRQKWGAEAETNFAHFFAGSTMADDKVCKIKVDGDHATISWDNIKDSTPLQLVKVDGHWLVDGHAMYEEATKDDPTKEPDQPPTAKLMKQFADDIKAGKYEDADAFMDDLKSKLKADGN